MIHFPGLRAPSDLSAELESELEGEDPYVFIPQGELGDDFLLGASLSSPNCEERIARLPEGVQAPVEPASSDESSENPQLKGQYESSLSSLDASIQVPRDETRWYDKLPGEPMYLDDSPEDLVVAESLIESLDVQRQAKLRVIREQEACLEYELGKGEGRGTKEWLTTAYTVLGELEAQMSRLQYEQLQRVGSAPLRMTPELARLDTKVELCRKRVPRFPSA